MSSVFKGSVHKRAARLRTWPWRVEVVGLVEKPRIFDIVSGAVCPEIVLGARRGAKSKSIFGPWPYTEALTMTEASNELTMLACGIYGHPLPNQHGAPLRLGVPWKYGFKSIKSVKVEFTVEQPAPSGIANRPRVWLRSQRQSHDTSPALVTRV